MSKQPISRGVYLSPAEVFGDGVCLKRLRDEGVQEVVLRTGFDPSKCDPHTAAAADAVRDAGMRLCLLVGGWWGEGIDPGPAAMQPLPGDWPIVTPEQAHESAWPMHCPCGPWSQVIAATVEELARSIVPDAICLTHARFHHAADLPSLFSRGSSAYESAAIELGLTPDALLVALRTVARRLADSGRQTIRASASPQGLGDWLDRWGQTDLFSRWFAFRSSVIAEAVGRVRNALPSDLPETPKFGVNMLNPFWCELSGQSLPLVSRGMDFIQPLLGYVHWHLVQPLEQWARWLTRMQPALSTSDATWIIAHIIGAEALADATPDHWSSPDVSPLPLLGGLMNACRRVLLRAGVARHRLQIVLRGNDWPAEWLRDQAQQWQNAGVGAIVYQGHASLTGSSA